jgi:hypothetical protein
MVAPAGSAAGKTLVAPFHGSLGGESLSAGHLGQGGSIVDVGLGVGVETGVGGVVARKSALFDPIG